MSERFHAGGKSFLYPWTALNASYIPRFVAPLRRGRHLGGTTDSQVAYRASASFLAYILDQGGPGRLSNCSGCGVVGVQTRFQQVYGRSLDEAERDWRAFCAAYRP